MRDPNRRFFVLTAVFADHVFVSLHQFTSGAREVGAVGGNGEAARTPKSPNEKLEDRLAVLNASSLRSPTPVDLDREALALQELRGSLHIVVSPRRGAWEHPVQTGVAFS